MYYFSYIFNQIGTLKNSCKINKDVIMLLRLSYLFQDKGIRGK